MSILGSVRAAMWGGRTTTCSNCGWTTVDVPAGGHQALLAWWESQGSWETGGVGPIRVLQIQQAAGDHAHADGCGGEVGVLSQGSNHATNTTPDTRATLTATS